MTWRSARNCCTWPTSCLAARAIPGDPALLPRRPGSAFAAGVARRNQHHAAVLDVLPRGPAQAQADHPVVGLHPRGDRAEWPVVAGADAGVAVYGLSVRKPARSVGQDTTTFAAYFQLFVVRKIVGTSIHQLRQCGLGFVQALGQKKIDIAFPPLAAQQL
jgi:hypothetical protein